MSLSVQIASSRAFLSEDVRDKAAVFGTEETVLAVVGTAVKELKREEISEVVVILVVVEVVLNTAFSELSFTAKSVEIEREAAAARVLNEDDDDDCQVSVAVLYRGSRFVFLRSLLSAVSDSFATDVLQIVLRVSSKVVDKASLLLHGFS